MSPAWESFAALGDSFTEGLQDRVDATGRHRGWADRVAVALDARRPAEAPPLRYANLAIRGRLLPQVIEEQVPAAVALGPDLVSLAAGVNDVLRRHVDLDANAALLESGVRQLRAGGSDVLVFAFGDPARRSAVMGRVRDRIEAYNDAVRGIADRHGCYLVDFWGCAVFDDDGCWDADRLHLSPAGHARAAGAALEALGVGDDGWRTPPASQPRPGLGRRVGGDIAWTAGHFGPWLLRRVRGVSSGDGVRPKRPELLPLAADESGPVAGHGASPLRSRA